MAQRSTEFGILLTRGIKSISVRENRSIAAVQDELGDQLGVTRWAIEKWRQGHIPGDPDLTLAIAHVCMPVSYTHLDVYKRQVSGLP